MAQQTIWRLKTKFYLHTESQNIEFCYNIHVLETMLAVWGLSHSNQMTKSLYIQNIANFGYMHTTNKTLMRH